MLRTEVLGIGSLGQGKDQPLQGGPRQLPGESPFHAAGSLTQTHRDSSTLTC